MVFQNSVVPESIKQISSMIEPIMRHPVRSCNRFTDTLVSMPEAYTAIDQAEDAVWYNQWTDFCAGKMANKNGK